MNRCEHGYGLYVGSDVCRYRMFYGACTLDCVR